MRRQWLALTLVTVLSLVGCKATPTPTPVEPTETPPKATEVPKSIDPFELDFSDRSIFSSNLVASEQAILEHSPEFSTYHIDLEIEDDLRSASGRLEVLYTNNEGGPLQEIYFRLFPNLVGGSSRVSSLKVDRVDNPSTLENANSALKVPLPSSLQPGESTTISMDFELELPVEMGGNYGLYGFFEDILVMDVFYPTIPVFNEQGWNVEIPPPNGDFSDNDAAYYVVRVSAPNDLVLVASGVPLDEHVEGDRQIKTYASGPARDFYIAASENFEVVSKTIDDVTVNSYAQPDDIPGAEFALQFALDSISSYSARFGLYPYTELDVVSTPMLALGVEYPGVIAITLEVYDVNGEFGGIPTLTYLESVIAHEVGHQWFYNVVGNDQMDEPWVDEAVVQYITALYYLDTYGPEGYQGYRQSWLDRWSRTDDAEIPIGLNAGEYTGVEYSAIVYGRGPLFVEALSNVMGQSVFDDFMRDYYMTNKWGIGTTSSFQALAEEDCGCDLDELFDEWVYGEN